MRNARGHQCNVKMSGSDIYILFTGSRALMFYSIFPSNKKKQARSKHKMTGRAERVARINPPRASVPRLKHTSWYMSDHYICLQYLLFLSNFPFVLTLTK